MSSTSPTTCTSAGWTTHRSPRWPGYSKRIILTSNVRDFRPLLREDSPGVVGIPATWAAERLDSKLTALLTRHGPAYFRGQVRRLGAEETRRAA